jgi:hypothetical protein
VSRIQPDAVAGILQGSAHELPAATGCEKKEIP